MPLVCPCSQCKRRYQISPVALGKKISCPFCKTVAVIAEPISRGTAGPTLSTVATPPAAPSPQPFASPTALPRKRKLPLPVLLGGAGLLILLLATVALVAVFKWGGGEGKPEPIVQNSDSPVLGGRKDGDAEQADQPPRVDPKPSQPAEVKDKPAGPMRAEEDRAGNVDEDGPPLLLQIHSLDRILADLNIILEKANQREALNSFLGVFRTPDGKVRLPGIDSNRPWGAYARIKANAEFAGLVALVPIADEAEFLRLLHMLQCSTSKNAEGVYEVKQAQLTKQVGFRFANRYAYVALDNFDAIRKEDLVEPNKVFVRDEEADVRLAFRMDRLPQQLRTQAVEGMQQAGPKTRALLPRTNPVVRDATEKLIDLLSRFGTDLVQDSRELSLNLRIDSRKQEFAADVRFRARDRSRLACSIASLQETASRFGDLNDGSPALRARVHFRLPEELRRIVATLSHEALEQTLREATDRDKHEEDERFVRAFEPTVAAGELDLAMFVNSSGPGKPPRAVTAFKVVKGLELEKAFRGLVGALPAAERAAFQLDVARAEGARIHRLDLRGKFPPQAAAVVGNDPFMYYAFRDDAVVVAVGESASESIGQLLASPPRQTPPALLELNVKHCLDAFPVSDAERQRARKVFTDANPGRVRLSVGEGSVLRLRIDLSLIQLLAEMGQLSFDPRIEVKQQ